MFTRKLTVLVVPLLMALVVCLIFPLLDGMQFFSNVLKGLLLGLALALVLPLSGAGKRKEPFGSLLWVPAVLLALVVAYQYLDASAVVSAPILSLFATRNGQVVLVECVFVGFLTTTCIRTKK